MAEMPDKYREQGRELRAAFYGKEVTFGMTGATLAMIGGGLGAILMALSLVAGVLGPVGAVLALIGLGVYRLGPYRANKTAAYIMMATLLSLLVVTGVAGMSSLMYAFCAVISGGFALREWHDNRPSP